MADSVIMIVPLIRLTLYRKCIFASLNFWRVGGFFCLCVMAKEVGLGVSENVFIVWFPSVLKSSRSLKISEEIQNQYGNAPSLFTRSQFSPDFLDYF